MKMTTRFSHGIVVSGVGLFLILGEGCDKSSSGGGAGETGGTPGTGGSTGSGGVTGAGGVTGTGGSSTVGTGGRSGGSGGNTAGGSGGSSVVGSGGSGVVGSGGSSVPGSGGRGTGGSSSSSTGGTGGGGGTAVGDAAVADARTDRNRAEASVPPDAAADAPAQTDTAAGSDGGCVPNYACTPVSPNTGDPYADCVARVNQFRACVCLPPLARWTAGEACADQDSQYDSQQNTAHAGANANICDWGNGQDECPDWTKSTPESVIDGCLLMMFQEGPPPSGSCTGSCFSTHGHYINMTGTGYKNGVACGFYTTSAGAVWAAQNFK
jgi:hypothetical protein